MYGKGKKFTEVRETRPRIESIKEVFFPGNHGDIGGGWNPEHEVPDQQERDALSKLNPLTKAWISIRTFFTGRRKILNRGAEKEEANPIHDQDWFQLSDLALKWMVDELSNLPDGRVHWDKEGKQSFLTRYHSHRAKAVKAKMHDTMAFGKGSSFGMTLMWKFMGKSAYLHCSTFSLPADESQPFIAAPFFLSFPLPRRIRSAHTHVIRPHNT